jgi:hypothetical protein
MKPGAFRKKGARLFFMAAPDCSAAMTIDDLAAKLESAPAPYFEVRLKHFFLMVGTCAFAFSLWRLKPNILSGAIIAFWIGVIFAQIGVSWPSRFFLLRLLLANVRTVGLLTIYISVVVGAIGVMGLLLSVIGLVFLSSRR